jgi:hypothetical protein
MIRDSRRFWPRTDPRVLAAIVFFLTAAPAAAQSSACNRAQAIVEEVKGMVQSGTPDHRAILQKLSTATQLCPTLSQAWKYQYCSALATGDAASARYFKDRAIFNGVSKFDCAGTGAPPPKPVLPSYVRQKFALVIGISKFTDKAIEPLEFAAKDANDFAAVLRDPRYGRFPPDNVTVLTDEKATRANILNEVQRLILLTREEDLVVVYVSSHGSPEQEDQGLKGTGYIITHDTQIKNLWVEAVGYQDFTEKLSRIPARRKVTFLDTCYSGIASRRGGKAMTIDGGIDAKTAKMFLSGEGTVVIASSGVNEQSWESETIHNSYFTHFLMAALKQPAPEPLNVKALFDYVSQKVADTVAREKGAAQHPRMQPETDPGDVRIAVAPRGD